MISRSLPSAKPGLCLKVHIFTPEIVYTLSVIKIKQSKTKEVLLNKYLRSIQYFPVVLDAGYNGEHTAQSSEGYRSISMERNIV